MSRYSETTQHLLDVESAVTKRVKNVFNDFIDFIASDNVLQVAVGLIIAKGFTDVVEALVSNVILPPVSLLPFLNRNLAEKFVVLRKGAHPRQSYNTPSQAIADGAVVLSYGAFFDRLFNFVALGFFLYVIAQAYGYLTNDTIIKHTVKCKYCKKWISEKATRCYLCTSWVDGREDRETSALAHHDHE